MARTRRKQPDSQRGSAIVEATVVIPLLILLMIGLIDFGLAFWSLAKAQESLRNVTRYLSRLPVSQLCTALPTDAKNLAVYGITSPTGSSKALVAGWQSAGVANISIVIKEGTAYNDSSETTIYNNTGTAPNCGSTEPKYRRIIMSATVPYNSFAMSALGLRSSITMNTSHEERWIGL